MRLCMKYILEPENDLPTPKFLGIQNILVYLQFTVFHWF